MKEETPTATSKPKSVFYDGAFKLKSDFEAAKTNNENIDDFKFPVYRALKYHKNLHDGIKKLCSNANLENIKNGIWIIEQPKMVDNKIQYSYMEDKDFHETFSKYDARGILGCGPGSERFV